MDETLAADRRPPSARSPRSRCAAPVPPPRTSASPATILNVSYDPTRELYDDYNAVFAKYWKKKTGQDVTVQQSNGGSGKQARAVIDGLQADVVTLGLAYDIDAIAHKAKLLPANWQTRLPNNSTPYTSTIVFLVRQGNPKHIHDWDDLVEARHLGDHAESRRPRAARAGTSWRRGRTRSSSPAAAPRRQKLSSTKLYKNVPVLDSGARGSTTTFVERGIGDVEIAWENDALLAVNKLGKGRFEIVRPSLSILAEPPVALVDAVVDQEGNARRRPGVSAIFSTRRRGRRSSRGTTSALASRRSRSVTPSSSPR